MSAVLFSGGNLAPSVCSKAAAGDDSVQNVLPESSTIVTQATHTSSEFAFFLPDFTGEYKNGLRANDVSY